MAKDTVYRLLELLEEMRRLKQPFNAALITGGDYDVAHLRLVDNATEWEACCETGTYDLWYKGSLVETNLSLSEAARRLVQEYQKVKIQKIMKRIAGKN